MPYQANQHAEKNYISIINNVDGVDAASSGKLPVVKPVYKRNSGLTKGLRVMIGVAQNHLNHSVPCTSSGAWIAPLSIGSPVDWIPKIHTHLSYLYMGLTPFCLFIFYDFIVTDKGSFVNTHYKKDKKIQVHDTFFHKPGKGATSGALPNRPVGCKIYVKSCDRRGTRGSRRRDSWKQSRERAISARAALPKTS